MRKILYLTLCMLTLMHGVSSGVTLSGVKLSGCTVAKLNGGGGADSDILLYWNCDSTTSGAALQKGTGTTFVGALVTSETGQVGNQLRSANGYFSGNDGEISIKSTTVHNTGTVGFFLIKNDSSNAGNITFSIEGNTGYPVMRYSFSQYYDFRPTFSGSALSGEVDFASPNNNRYIEFSWDRPNSKLSYRVDGGSWVEGTSITIADLSSATELRFVNTNANSEDMSVDQIMYSNVYQKDLYSKRNETSV